ncbi:RNA polymerase sigma factor [Robbsia andropogonis]|nr:sigma-70 family RNA polymerase sigma factor [Robbsia andropogonis]
MKDMICSTDHFHHVASLSKISVSLTSVDATQCHPEVNEDDALTDGAFDETITTTSLDVEGEPAPASRLESCALLQSPAAQSAGVEPIVHTMPFTGYVDENALFKELIDRHASRLYRFILKHIGNASDAEELAQQTFVEAVQAYRTFRGDSQLSTWLYGIAMNLVRNYLSRAPHRRHHMTDDSILDDMPESEIAGRTVHDPEQRFAQSQLFAQMDIALAELPVHMRELLILVGVEALSYEEAAVMLTIPIGTVRSRLSRARKALSEKLAARGIVL